MKFTIINNRPEVRFTVNGHPVYSFNVRGIIAGTGGGSINQTLDFIAGENLSSGRAVIKQSGKVYYFDPNNITHAGRAIGITTTSALTDAAVTVQFAGTLIDAAFGFTVDKPVFIDSNGQLTTTITTTTLLQKAGLSLAANKMVIEFDLSMVRI